MPRSHARSDRSPCPSGPRLALGPRPSSSLASPPAAEQYLLGPQDQVRLKIYEWRASRDIIFEWTALNDPFTVGADGTLSLPFVGTIQAEGRRMALAGTIAQRLVQQMGLGQAPDVAVEVVQFRPFYILGHVMQPGEFPYRPGLNVLEAVTIAGGLRPATTAMPLEREVIAGQGEVDVLGLSSVSLLARKARLKAELSGRMTSCSRGCLRTARETRRSPPSWSRSAPSSLPEGGADHPAPRTERAAQLPRDARPSR